MMNVGRAALLGVVGVVAALPGVPQRALAQSVQACTSNCAQVTVNGGTGTAGGTVTATLSFAQAPNDNQPGSGGPAEIAALALTLSMTPDGTSTPLTLADCTLDADGLPAAVKPDPSISNFRVVVENASCAGRDHCLCPDAGQTQDNFINIVVYGPNPLPNPGPNPIDIPILPTGPGPLMTIDLNIAANASGTIPLHIYNQVQDASPPQYHALLSVGDEKAVDQTCVPVANQPPCTSQQSQIAFTDGSVNVNASGLFLVCDVVPFTGDDAGQFGGSGIKNNDVVAIFNASLQTGVVPADGTARFSAMDSVTVDTPPNCGGDTNLKNNDVVACFNRSLGNGDNYDRALSGSACTSTLVPQ
jgi:hypothetical protein